MTERVARRVTLLSYINLESDETSNLFEYKLELLSSFPYKGYNYRL